jgi:conjugative transfer signal peptidase TraF
MITTKNKIKALFTIALTSLLLVSFMFLVESRWIIINTTSSMKPGLYFMQSGSIRRGDIVGFCLPKADQELALARHYVSPSQTCHGATPLLKRVVALPHDAVVFTSQSLTVAGKKIALTISLQDGQGRALTHYPYGIYPDSTGYWLLGNDGTISWDSRYFGPIPAALILGKYR